MPQDITDDRVSTANIARVASSHVERLAQHKLESGDIVYGRRGDIGRHALISSREAGWLCGTGCLRISLGSSVLHPAFLHYYLSESSVIEWIYNQAVGATMPNLNTTILRSIVVPCPPLSVQLLIVDILSAYDKLIENNTRRIAILEEMAQAIYREWFVNFRFPGDEDAERVESELGLIPARWEVTSVGSLIQSSLGGDWGSEARTERETTPVMVIRGTDFADIATGSGLRVPLRFITESSFQRRKLSAGDVVVENSVNGRTRSTGSTLLVTPGVLKRMEQDPIAASFCKVFRPLAANLGSLIHLHMKHLRETKQMEYYQVVAANGIANFQATRFLSDAKLALPRDGQLRDNLLEHLHALTQSTFADSVYVLRQTRDLLVPKLISGEIDVEALDRDTVEAVA
jgi:type I restriction enzyme S subunit